MRRSWMLLVLGVIAASIGVWMLGGALVAPVPRAVGPPPKQLAGALTVEFPSGSGSTIRAWFAPGVPGRGSVVLAHAVRGDRRGMLSRAEFLQRAGYSVLLFDAQAHGESQGDRITFGYLEALDAAAAVAISSGSQISSPKTTTVAMVTATLMNASKAMGSGRPSA